MRTEQIKLPLYQTDFIVSWDTNGQGDLAISVSRMEMRDGHLAVDPLGTTTAKSGSFSFRQVVEAYETYLREKEARDQRARDFLRKQFHTPTKDDAAET